METQRVKLKRNREHELETAVNDLIERGYVELRRGFHEGEPHVQLKISDRNKLGGLKKAIYSPKSDDTVICNEFYWAELERTEESFQAWLKERMEGLK